MNNAERRWIEIKLYYFCLDIYHIRNELYDVSYAIETISQIGIFKIQRLKALSARMLSDITLTPALSEVVHLAYAHGLSLSQIASFVNKKSKNTIAEMLKKEPPNYIPIFNEKDSIEVAKFIKLLDIFQKAGIPDDTDRTKL